MKTKSPADCVFLLAMAVALSAGAVYAKSPLAKLNPFSWGSSKDSDKPGSLPEPSASQKADLQMSIGRSLEREGKLEQAVVIYSDVVKKDGHRIDAYQRLAIVNDQLGNFEESDKFYRLALKREPKNAELLCDRGYSFYLQSRHAEAEQAFRKAIEINPRLARAHNNLALVLAQNERDDQALAEFAQGGCHEAEARVNLAFCMMARRDWRMARRELQRASAADPKSPAIQQGLAYLRAKAPAEVAEAAPALPVTKPVIAQLPTVVANSVPAISEKSVAPSATMTSYEIPNLTAGAVPPIAVENATFSELLARAQVNQIEQSDFNRQDVVTVPAELGNMRTSSAADSSSQTSQAKPAANEQTGVASPQSKSELRIVERRRATGTVNR
jgi:tetratricopeptide (TPR) repeat protein